GHRHHREAESESDRQNGERKGTAEAAHHDCAAADEHERERAHQFGQISFIPEIMHGLCVPFPAACGPRSGTVLYRSAFLGRAARTLASRHRQSSCLARARLALGRHDTSRHGTMAKARAGKPSPFLTLGQVTTITAPVTGTLSRLAIASIW